MPSKVDEEWLVLTDTISDTSFQLDDYNASALHAADAINPGTNNVCLLLLCYSSCT